MNIVHRLARLIEGQSAGEQVTKAGGYVDIGPECFGLADGSVICWRGENYTPNEVGSACTAAQLADRCRQQARWLTP